MKSHTITIQMLQAPNDRNGNPRRLFVVNAFGDILIWEGGYDWSTLDSFVNFYKSNLLSVSDTILPLYTLNISVKEYKRMKRHCDHYTA